MTDGSLDTAVAVIGMAGRFPGAPDVDSLWRDLAAGKESITFFAQDELLAAGVSPAELADPRYVPARGALQDVEGFDAALFGYSPRDAEIIDPQQRLFLECAWEATEHAGYDTTRFAGQVGVYAGSSISSYLVNLLTNEHLMRTVGQYRLLLANDKDHLTMRVAHKLDLRGPAITVQTACSTSLVAVHQACQSLLAQECDMALAGGVTVTVPQVAGYRYEDEGIMSPDGHCRAFDAASRGTVAGSGAGVVVLRRLDDALRDGDTVHAVILGSAVNNDGAGKAGYTTPSRAGQAEVITEALDVAGVDPTTVSYVEAHGTGTTLGDPIEIAALGAAMPAGPTGRAIGSIKTNIGHLDVAAGIAGLIKTVLALRHRSLPPSLHFTIPNPRAGLAEAGLRVNTAPTPWSTTPGQPRRAGVSSFGMGGTNAHVVLEEAGPPTAAGPAREWHVLAVSAATPTALRTAAANLAGHLAKHPSQLADMAYTLQVGRRQLAHRQAVVCRSAEDAVAALTGSGGPELVRTGVAPADRRTVFMFPGQGTQRSGVLAELYLTEAVVRKHVDWCARLVTTDLGVDLREALVSPTGPSLLDTAIAQPALFTVEYALARLWMSWGVQPDAMLGHSVGEYVAACLADVLAVDDALALLVARGRLMQALAPGDMMSVALPEAELAALTGPEIGLAAVNAPDLGVLSGTPAAVAEQEARLAERGIRTRRLRTSHAFHSPLVEPAMAEFRTIVARIPLRAPRIRFVSGVTGTWITDANATSADYWTEHLRSTVRFSDGVTTVLDGAPPVLLEVGPGDTLTTLARRHNADAVVTSLPPQPSEVAALMPALARLWTLGTPIDWAEHHRVGRRRRIPLPTYPFERQRHWIDGPAGPAGPRTVPTEPPVVAAGVEPAGDGESEVDELEQVVIGIWQDMLGVRRVGRHDSFVDLGGHSLVATQVTARLRETFGVKLTIAQVFDLGSPARLAAEIERLLVAELAALSDDEVRRLTESGGTGE